jgi:xanthine dehydrogenase accessory factor
MPDWRAAALAALAAEPVALVTILATEGSAPRGAGTRMMVTADGLAGTVGGGALEHRLLQQARLLLDEAPGCWRIQDYPLGPFLGQCCGGRVRALVERLDADNAGWIATAGAQVVELLPDRVERRMGNVPAPLARGSRPEAGARFGEPEDGPRLPVMLFGAGHVGTAIAALCEGLPLALAWYDSRAEAAERPGVVLADEEMQAACAAEASSDTAVLVLTHDHQLDYRLVAAALGSQAGFVGLIGSATKRARFLGRLARDGIDATRLTCPIGLPGITGKEPAVIAIAAVGQLLTLPR